jgi:hypothetical protein
MRFRCVSPRFLSVALPAILFAAVLLSGCAQHDLDLGRGGFSAEDSARLSLALAQVRAQAPAASVSGLPYVSRPEPEGLPEPELALTGEATGLSRGFQTGQKPRLRLALYLDKSSYTRGYAKVTQGGSAEEVWRIVAYELRGQADRDFQFTYLLADPTGNLRTLMLLGGTYREAETDLAAIEGVMFFPDPAPHTKRYSPAEWATAFPFGFVLKEPATPAYVALTTQAEDLFREIDRDVPDLDRLAQRIDNLAAEADAAPAAGAPSGDPAAATPPTDTPKPASPDDPRRKELEQQLRQRSALAQAKAVHYYQLRGEADSAFAAYLGTNGYIWRDADGQQDAFTKWEILSKQSDTFEDRVAHLLPYVPEPQKLDQARAAALALVAKNKNAAKRPAVTKS